MLWSNLAYTPQLSLHATTIYYNYESAAAAAAGVKSAHCNKDSHATVRPNVCKIF